MKNIISKTLFIFALVILAPLPAQAAKMALYPASGTLISGCPVAINIIINTEGENSMAADAFLFYNPNEIEIIDQMTSVSGIQIKPGNVYESYPGNIVSNGVIRLTGFNQQGYYNGRGILASIVFKSKPGVQSANINFDFTPGSTVDSNVADVDAKDMLNGAYGGSYKFQAGKCEKAVTPPKTEDKKPLGDDITFILIDDLVGIVLDTLTIEVNDITYTKDGEHRFMFEGDPKQYKITIPLDKEVLDKPFTEIKINVKDLNGNVIPEKIYGLNEFIYPRIINLRKVECEPCPDALRYAAPTKITGATDWWPWWIVLLCSLILNWHLIQRSNEKKKVKGESVKKRTRKNK